MNARELADPNNQLVISHPAPGEMSIQNFEKKTAHTFEFEQIFDSTKKQAEIFAEVSDLVVSVLDGYNVWSARDTENNGRQRRRISSSAHGWCNQLIACTLLFCFFCPLLQHLCLRTDGQWGDTQRARPSEVERLAWAAMAACDLCLTRLLCLARLLRMFFVRCCRDQERRTPCKVRANEQ